MWVYFEWDLCLPAGAMVCSVALGIWVILKVKRWRDGGLLGDVSPAEQLDDYQKMVDDGLLAPDELARIKAKLEAPAQPQVPAAEPKPPPPVQPPDDSIQEK